MITKTICIFAAILPLAIYGSTFSENSNLISGEIDNDKVVRNRVAVGDKELSSAEALEFLSNLAKNSSQNKGPTEEGSLPILPPGGGGMGGEFGPVIPENTGNNKGPINPPVIPKEENNGSDGDGGGGMGGEFGPVIPENTGNNKGPINPPVIPKEENTGSDGDGFPTKSKIDIDNPNPSGRMRCQDERTKLFISTAQACTDTRGTELCKSLFAAPDFKTGRRDPKCDQPGYEDIAKSCRKQCAICCEDMNYA
uniref:ShKT domain-containing protein n=1 Tax=Panagrolaimus sp. ES5 TaxID=591445 RepID=A0AC34FGM8_9BILA